MMDRKKCAAQSASKGAHLDAESGTLIFTVYSRHATRIEAWIYDQPSGGAPVVERVSLTPLAAPEQQGLWRASVSGRTLAKAQLRHAIYYGLRAWGPNWRFDPGWAPGTELGFLADVDEDGNRFNPNKLLLDPYAIEVSHDPAQRLSHIDPNECVADYDSGPGLRSIDTGPFAPKAVIPLCSLDESFGHKPSRALRDDVVYEAHTRGFTRSDVSIPEAYRGTFRGAALKASYLRELGVTAIELLPVQHFASEQNDDLDPRGDNYWGYMTLGYFAPNRRYAADRSPGGPTREFKAMVRAFHDV